MSNVLDEVVEGFDPMPDLLSVMAASSTPALLGLDIGTSGIRAAIFDERGKEMQGASVRINSTGPGLLDSGTMAAEVLLDQVVQAIDEVLANIYDPGTRVGLIAISCFWHSLVGVNSSGDATTPVIGWNDLRASSAARQLKSEFNEAEIHARTGCRFHASYWPAKLLRLRSEEPETFVQTQRWLSFSEYLALRFFGEAPISVSMASGTGLLNQSTCEWEVELLNGLDVGIQKLPDISATGRTLDQLTHEYALRWPQLSEARLFPAIGDGAANNVGAGCISKERIALMVGTSGAMRVVYEGAPPDTIPPELWCYRVDRDRVVVGGALSDGGNLHRWIRTTLLNEFDAQSIEDELDGLEPDGHGLTVLPFWSGERSTGWHEHARGTIHGLSPATQPIEILRAAMEAVAYRFALIAHALRAVAPNASFIASGYALCSSPVWVQILADVLGSPIQLSQSDEASTRGAALLALEAAGKIQSIDRPSATVATKAMVFEPDMTRHEKYRNGLERQQHLYEKLILKTQPTSGR
jgi:gluconokinase